MKKNNSKAKITITSEAVSNINEPSVNYNPPQEGRTRL